jgi:hypothetical protein
MTDRGTGEFYFFANPASGTVFLYLGARRLRVALAPMLDLVMQRP